MTKAGLGGAVLLAVLLLSPARAEDAAAPTAAGLLSASDRQTYEAAFEQAEAKRFDRARALAGRAGEPLLAKVVHWLDLIEPRPEGDFSALAGFLRENPDWPGQAALRQHAELVMPEDLADADVLAWFEARAPITVEGASRHADALLRAGQHERATALVRATWIERDLAERDERAFRARYGGLLREADDIARLDRLLWDLRQGPAKRQARRLGGGYPALAEARLALARGRPGVDSAIARVPADLHADPGLIFERARWRQRRGRYADVIALLDPPQPAAPRPDHWWPLRHWAARQALANGDISVAYRIAANHGLATGTGFAEAEWLAGWIALRFLDQAEGAYDHFVRLHQAVRTPISLARSAFWAGEAATAMGPREPAGVWSGRAHRWYRIAAEHRTSFYGQLANQRLGLAPTVDLGGGIAPSAQVRAAFEARELVRIVRLLGELDQAKLQERFLVRLRVLAGTADEFALVAELADRQGRTDLALSTARDARSQGIILPEHLFPSLPLPDGETPERALMLALIRQESGFHPEAVSRAGARGLMQVLPGTARQVARRIKVRYNKRKLLSDPDYNLRLGTAYLSELLERFGGSYVLALAAYNAGPSRAGRWIDAFGDPRDPAVDAVDWIESIPLDETRNYVQRILEGLVVYRQQLGGPVVDALGPPLASPLRLRSHGDGAPGDLSCCL